MCVYIVHWKSEPVLYLEFFRGGRACHAKGPIVALTTYDCQKWSDLAKTGQGGGAVSIAKVVHLCRRRSLGPLAVMMPLALNISFC